MRKKLRLIRLKKGLTQKKLADKIGISYPNYCLIERGKRIGNLTTWIKIKKVLNIPKAEMWEIINEK